MIQSLEVVKQYPGDLQSLLESRLVVAQVVDETQPFQGGLMALSNFGFGGANFHMVLRGQAAERAQLLLSDSSSSSGGSSNGEPTIGDNIVPLAARTAHGLAYLAKIINQVNCIPSTFPQHPQQLIQQAQSRPLAETYAL